MEQTPPRAKPSQAVVPAGVGVAGSGSAAGHCHGPRPARMRHRDLGARTRVRRDRYHRHRPVRIRPRRASLAVPQAPRFDGLHGAQPGQAAASGAAARGDRARHLRAHGLPAGRCCRPFRHPAAETAYLSRYALGRDYHKTVRRRLVRLANRIDRHAGGRYRAFTDSAPVLEKPLAEKAGLGWIGKNTLTAHGGPPGRCSSSARSTRACRCRSPNPTRATCCGACKACINVCPTGAILGPGQLDARRCISYLTDREQRPDPARNCGRRSATGCSAATTARSSVRGTAMPARPRRRTSPRATGWTRPASRTCSPGTRRPSWHAPRGWHCDVFNYRQWVRNLAVAAGNATAGNPAPSAALIARLGERRADPDVDAMAREHIDWALERLHAAV